MSGCRCGRAVLRGDGDPEIGAHQEAAKNSRQSNTILENSPKGTVSHMEEAADNAVSHAEGMVRT